VDHHRPSVCHRQVRDEFGRPAHSSAIGRQIVNDPGFAQVDAILVGGETIRADNPRLTVRGRPGARQPWRIVLTRSKKLPAHSQIFTDRLAHRTKVYRGKDLRTVLRQFGKEEITSVLIEGGGNILSQALDERLIDKVQVYVAPILSGGPTVAFAGTGAAVSSESARLARTRYEMIGSDVCVTGYPRFDWTESE
jgi:diaminohydroxyphosphoribosylaminopyrimidine deaminase/5-amino-6-(5-phosphoribosylamino)uracil reductase